MPLHVDRPNVSSIFSGTGDQHEARLLVYFSDRWVAHRFWFLLAGIRELHLLEANERHLLVHLCRQQRSALLSVVPQHRHEQLLARELLIEKLARARRSYCRALSRQHQPACKPGSVGRDFSRAAAIPLGRRSLAASSSQPEWRIRRRISVARCHSYSALLPVGFAVPRMLPPARWALTPPFHPYSPSLYPSPYAGRVGWGKRFAFCGTFPGVAPAGRYPAPCLRGARTFLCLSAAAARPTDAQDVRARRPNVKAHKQTGLTLG